MQQGADPETLSMIEAREKLTHLPEKLAQNIEQNKPPVVKVTRHNKPVLAIIPWDLYEAIVETLEILGDEEQVSALRQGIQEAAAGMGKPWSRCILRSLICA